MKLEEIYYHIRIPKDENNFWELNQELSYVDPFAELKESEIGAKIMMAIYMMYDPKSQLVNSGIGEGKIKKDVSKNFLGDENFDWSPYRKVVAAYKSYSKTKIEKQLDSWWLQLLERDEYLNNELEWGIGDDNTKENMMLKTDEHYAKYKNITASLKEERQEKLMYGKYVPSMLEAWSLEES